MMSIIAILTRWSFISSVTNRPFKFMDMICIESDVENLARNTCFILTNLVPDIMRE